MLLPYWILLTPSFVPSGTMRVDGAGRLVLLP